MTHTETLKPPTKSHCHAVTGLNYAYAAVTGIGQGFTVTLESGGFVTLTATDSNGMEVSIGVSADGVPTLIAALQQAHTEAQS